MKDSSIKWTKHTYNPWIGCTRVGTECLHCYAEHDNATRFRRVEWGPGGVRRRTCADTLKAPLKWNQDAREQGIRQQVFCASYSDVFDDHPSIEQAWRDDLWDMIRRTPNLDWLLLTKRPHNFAKYLPQDWGDGYPNVCLMVTAGIQSSADLRIPVLLNTPAIRRGISVEPLLGPIDLEQYVAKLDWVIVGGESGTGARPMEPQWARTIRDQCAKARKPFFFKQWGNWSPRIRKGAPTHTCASLDLLYHKNDRLNHGGNELDGRIHEEHPFQDVVEPVATQS